MANRLKHLVSKRKRRFVENGFDLDLTCILTKLICMIYVVKSTKHTLLVPSICGAWDGSVYMVHVVCQKVVLLLCQLYGVGGGGEILLNFVYCSNQFSKEGSLLYIAVCWIELAPGYEGYRTALCRQLSINSFKNMYTVPCFMYYCLVNRSFNSTTADIIYTIIES
jgi:hypothetical protein